jgi:hypothetical protein
MANDRDTKSRQVKPERPQDTSAAIRANDGETMAGGKDGDLKPHGEAGSSGAGRSASRTGTRGDDVSDIGSSDKMTGSTGGLAGTSR